MKVVNQLINSIRSAANHNPEVETKPHCILWTDKERQWENAIPRLQIEMQELLAFGEYDPVVRKGPAIWLRVVIGGLADGFALPYGKIPVIYLPGVSRQDLRAVEQCPTELKPLAELQYRGVIWSQTNARDWTILAYLKTPKGGLNLEIAQDDATLNATQRALNQILEEEIDKLKINHLDADFFNSMVSGTDPIKDILLWMSEPDKFKIARTQEEWQAFVEICKSKYKIHPEEDGAYTALEKIAWKDDSWEGVWDRFCEAPQKYKIIPDILRKSVMPIGCNYERFPQWNEQQEDSLRKDLSMIPGMTEQDARESLIKLEAEHGARRDLVWADLGESPLAGSMKWLSEMANATSTIINGSIDEIAQAQESWGWQVDHEVLMALSSVIKKDDLEAVIAAIRTVYLPWIDNNARNLQKISREQDYPVNHKHISFKEDECVCFIDGLRFDLGKQLSGKLKNSGYAVKEKVTWSPLPTVTSTCKPALTPVADKITGDEMQNQDFTPVLIDNNQPVTFQRLSNLIDNAGWDVLMDNNVQRSKDKGWYEFGTIDEDGHSMGWRIALNIEGYLNEVLEQVELLLNSGWKSVRIVSDHGWLLMPKGLPKVPLVASLTENKWGRCASIKPGALFDGTLYPWYWNSDVHFALADGVSCYRNGIEYTHGGISLQECLMLQLVLHKNEEVLTNSGVYITDIVWKGMRCNVAVDGNFLGIKADIRLKPAQAETSIAMGLKPINKDGIVSVVVDDDSKEGETAYFVLLNDKNEVVFQTTTIVGGEM